MSDSVNSNGLAGASIPAWNKAMYVDQDVSKFLQGPAVSNSESGVELDVPTIESMMVPNAGTTTSTGTGMYDYSGGLLKNADGTTGNSSTGTNWSSMLGNVGTAVNALSGLASMYFADKNYKLQKDAQAREEAIQNRQIAKQDEAQANYDATLGK